MNEAQMPIEQAQRPVLPIKDEGKTVGAVYVWKTGRTFYPSRKERTVAEIYVRRLKEFLKEGRAMAGVYQECIRALKELGVVKKEITCKRWLERGHVRDWIGQQFKGEAVDKFWTKENWLSVMTDHLQGVKRLANGDLYGMSLIAKVRGWDVVQGGMQVGSIQILQANGER